MGEQDRGVGRRDGYRVLSSKAVQYRSWKSGGKWDKDEETNARDILKQNLVPGFRAVKDA